MNSFTDTAGRTWSFDIAWDDVVRFHAAHPGVDLFAGVSAGQAYVLWSALLFFSRKERAAAKVEEKPFLRAIQPNEKVQAEAIEALTAALNDFFSVPGA